MINNIKVIDVEVVETRIERTGKFLRRSKSTRVVYFLTAFCMFYAFAFPFFGPLMPLVFLTDPAIPILCVSLWHLKKRHYAFEHKFKVYRYE